MTGTAALNALLGAALVAIGILAAALADRIRGIRLTREPRESRRGSVAARTAAPIEVIEPELATTPSPKPERAKSPRPENWLRDLGKHEESKLKTQDGADDVIAALVAAGYKKPIATEATWGCSQAERATIENWTRAALRRCARGGMS